MQFQVQSPLETETCLGLWLLYSIRQAEKVGSHEITPAIPTLKQNAAKLINRTFEG